MNNTKHFVFVSFSIILVVALFIAMICSYFLPFGDEKVFAEVSSFSTNTTYEFSQVRTTLTSSTSSSYTYDSSCSGVLSYNNNSYSFTRVGWRRYYTGVIYVYDFIFVNGDVSSYLLRFDYSNGILISAGVNASSLYSVSESSFIGSTIVFSSVPSSTLYSFTFFSSNLSLVIVELNPEISVVSAGSLLLVTDFYSSGSYDYHDYNGNMFAWRLDNASDFTFVDGIFTFDFDLLRYSEEADRWYLYYSSTISFISNSDGYAYAIPILDSSFYNTHGVSKILLRYGEDSSNPDGYVELSGNAFAAAINNYQFIKAYHQNALLASYDIGYAAGMDADQTLLSVIWSTFELPFRLLFGTWDNYENAYVGGLFNFHILGVDIRAFVLGLMSACIVVAIIRFILGSKGS